LIATDLTPCWMKNSFISFWTFGLVVTSVATQRLMIVLAPSCRITPAAILVVVLSSGPYRATVPIGNSGGLRCFISYSSMAASHKEMISVTSGAFQLKTLWLLSILSQ